MKIVCDSCGAKYSIADEKVAGKVFKIRCKRCSEVIVVRGEQEAAAAAPAVAADAIWHVVVDGEQQGPVTPAELGVMLSEGTIDWEAFVWTEGFDNWAAMRDVEDLVAQITGGGGEEQPAESPTTTAAGGFGAVASDAFAGEASMGADPFADDEPTVAASDDLFASAAGGAASASAGSPLIGGGAATASAAPSPRVTQEQAMTGARNENSVLFSLKNLQALATGSSTPSVNPSMSAPGQQQAGMAGGEGSGLIDIRALASAAGAGGGAASSGSSKPAASDKDDLLSLGGQAGGLGALSSPLMAPAPEEREGGGKGLLIASILGGAVLVAGGLVAFGMMNRQDPQPSAAVAPVAPAAAAAVPGVQPAEPASDTAKEKVAEAAEKKAEKPEEQAADEAEDKADDDDDAKSSRSAARERRRKAAPRKRSSSRSSSSSSPAPAPEKKEEPAPKPRRKSSANASIDDLLEGALGGGGSKRKAAAPAPASNLPEKPSRDDVLSAMNGVKGAVSACNDGSGGVAVANITVKGSTGRVTNATIEGKTGAVGSCVAKAVRRARFPKFQASTFKVKFPFRL